MSTYIDTKPGPSGGYLYEPGHSWSEQAKRRLVWMYGQDRAESIMAGTDAKTEDDIEAWNSFGSSLRSEIVPVRPQEHAEILATPFALTPEQMQNQARNRSFCRAPVTLSHTT